ncbi:4-hydroxy-tetrahydrodipicolinate synthase [Amaricoccus macauensis]|uniref:4-hydroxy-tetrahydrodipicolinate synthase n=1 Tax=Amaricoccus macauensis TaxID=57001 RepID=A0A840SS24_9RHOB|nr:dihydrodipicolinate synthase family protein [Amaricoccus macauensis]MBB5222636.1 4-hydroxy-tetrahydrodipicolinate synthase [Amaricoccus macauensis]
MSFGTGTTGVYPIAATPFHPDGRLDLDGVDRLTDFYQDAGATGMTILGIMGEAQKLEPEESRAIARRVVARSRVPVVVGVSAPGFAAMRSLARDAMDAGAAGVMVAPAPHLRSDEQIAAYFAQAVEAIGPDVPWALQDYPLTLSVILSVPVIARIMAEHPSCVMLKAEDWPGLEKLTALRKLQADGTLRPFSILTANGGIFLDFEPERGSDGAMTGYAFPDMLVELIDLHARGERDAAHDLFDAHLPLIRYEQQPGVGLSVRKYVLMRRGVIGSDVQRKPGPALSATGRAEVDYLLERLARKDARAAL